MRRRSARACGDVAGTGSITSTVDLAVGGVVTFTLTAVVADDAEGSIVNTAAVSVPGDTSDPDPETTPRSIPTT